MKINFTPINFTNIKSTKIEQKIRDIYLRLDNCDYIDSVLNVQGTSLLKAIIKNVSEHSIEFTPELLSKLRSGYWLYKRMLGYTDSVLILHKDSEYWWVTKRNDKLLNEECSLYDDVDMANSYEHMLSLRMICHLIYEIQKLPKEKRSDEVINSYIPKILAKILEQDPLDTKILAQDSLDKFYERVLAHQGSLLRSHEVSVQEELRDIIKEEISALELRNTTIQSHALQLENKEMQLFIETIALIQDNLIDRYRVSIDNIWQYYRFAAILTNFKEFVLSNTAMSQIKDTYETSIKKLRNKYDEGSIDEKKLNEVYSYQGYRHHIISIALSRLIEVTGNLSHDFNLMKLNTLMPTIVTETFKNDEHFFVGDYTCILTNDVIKSNAEQKRKNLLKYFNFNNSKVSDETTLDMISNYFNENSVGEETTLETISNLFFGKKKLDGL